MISEKVYPHKWGKHVNWSELNGLSGKIVINNGMVGLLLDDNRLIVIEDNINPNMPIPEPAQASDSGNVPKATGE